METTKVLLSKKDGLKNKQDGRRLSKKANKKDKLQEKKVRGRNESIEIPELSALEMEEFQTRIDEYCNPPSKPHYGVEGKKRSSLVVSDVKFLTRNKFTELCECNQKQILM